MADRGECERQLTVIDGDRENRPEHHEGLYTAYTIHAISTCHQPFTNDNYINLLPSEDMCYEGYEDYPPLDDEGDIHGAQPERERFDESLMPNDTFCIDGVVVDNIDRELRGLLKDIYIRKLLELTHSSEEAVIFYREEMSRRARLQPNGPSGVIKTRR